MSAALRSGPVPASYGQRTDGSSGAGAAVDAEFGDLYRSLYGRVVRALELAGSSRAAAEDDAQEAFARTYARWASVRRGTNPAGYVVVTAFRLASRRRRRRGKHPGSLLEEPRRSAMALRPGEPADVRVDVAGEATTAAAVRACLATMPPRRRACAVACFVCGLSPAEAARALRIAPGTVRKQLQAARADLAEVLGGAARPPGNLGRHAPPA